MAEEIPSSCSTAAQSNDSHPTFDHFIDQVRVRMFHFAKFHRGVVQVIGRAYLHADSFWAVKNLGNGIDCLENETTPILNCAAVTVCSLVGATDKLVSKFIRLMRDRSSLRIEKLLRQVTTVCAGDLVDAFSPWKLKQIHTLGPETRCHQIQLF